MLNCLHSRERLWKEVAIKEKCWWLLLMTSPLGQKGPVHHQECMIQTSSDPMLSFRPMRNISEKQHHRLKELFTSRLSMTPTFPYGLPPRIGTTFSLTLMMRTSTWWKNSAFSLFQNHRVQTQNLHFLLHLFTNIQGKVWVSFLYQYNLHFLPYTPWIVCFYWYLYIWIWVFDLLEKLLCDLWRFCCHTLLCVYNAFL